MKNSVDGVFGPNMRRVRQARGLTLEDVAKGLETVISVVSKIERCDRRVSIGEAVAIAAALGVDLTELASEGLVTMTVQV